MLGQGTHEFVIKTRGRGFYEPREHRRQAHTRRVAAHLIGE
jgi:hypothetical protein